MATSECQESFGQSQQGQASTKSGHNCNFQRQGFLSNLGMAVTQQLCHCSCVLSFSISKRSPHFCPDGRGGQEGHGLEHCSLLYLIFLSLLRTDFSPVLSNVTLGFFRSSSLKC